MISLKHTKLSYISIIFLLILQNLDASNYYISNKGRDDASGLSPETSLKTIDKLNSIKLNAGDSILFKSGDTFTGTLKLQYSGTLTNPIFIGTYGGNEKAKLIGSKEITNIKKTDDYTYEAPCEDNILYFFLDGKIMTIAREPNEGFFTMEGGGIDYLVDKDLKYEKETIIGATARMRITNWNYEYREVIDFYDYKVVFDSMLYNTSFKNYTCKPNLGYYLDNKAEFLDINNECYRSAKDKKVYFISSDYHDQSSLYGITLENGLIIKKGVSNITIKDIAIEDYYENAIYAKGDNKNITVENCEVFNIIKMGFFAETGCDSIMIINSHFYDILGTAIRLKAPGYSKIDKNKVNNIGLIAGYGIDGINGAIGISVENPPILGLKTDELSNNNVISNNHVDSTGYMSARMDGIHCSFEGNIVKNGLLTMNDGGLIHTYGEDLSDGINLNYTHSSVIRNNIFMNCFGNTESYSNDHKMNHGIYLDARSNKFTVENNIVVNCGAGILLNDKTRDCIVRNNILYGNHEEALEIVQSNQFNNLGHLVENNIFFNTINRKSTLVLTNNRETKIEPGIIRNNIYVSPDEMFHIKMVKVEKGKWKNTREYTLEGWQEEFGNGADASFIEVNKKEGYLGSNILINDTENIMVKKPEPGIIWKDLYDNVIPTPLSLTPGEAIIISEFNQ